MNAVFIGLICSCHQLEVQLQSTTTTTNDVEIQCSFEKVDQMNQTDDENIEKNIETEKLKSQNDILQDEINDLKFQLSTFHIQRTTSENVSKRDYFIE